MLVSLGLACVVHPAAAVERMFVYISASGDNRIQIFEVADALEPRGQVDLEGAPGAMTMDPKRRMLYVAVRTKNSVAAFEIGDSAQLKSLGMTPVADNPVYLATDKQGRYLLTAYYTAGKAAIYPIKPDGAIAGVATSLVMTDKNPHSIQADPSNRFVFVPNTGADKVLQFKFDAATGKIAPNSPPELATGTDTGPRHFWFHPQGNYVYFVNEKGSSVTCCRLDAQSGTLSAFQTISTLPADFAGNNTCAHIETTPDGKYLYASNRGHDSLACFAVDAATGKLTSLGQQPTEKTPRAFAIDPSGRILLAAGQGSDRLAKYSIGQDGRLQPLAVYPVGKSPAWVQFKVQ
jgi:6-phosphogluconolactonase